FVRTLASDPAVAIDCVTAITDGRFIRRTLSREEPAPDGGSATSVALSSPKAKPSRKESWKILADPSQILSSVETLKGYEVIVVGRDAEVFLNASAIENLQRWISREGGSMVCYRGAPTAQVNQQLAKLLPVSWTRSSESRFRVKLTDQGRDLHW